MLPSWALEWSDLVHLTCQEMAPLLTGLHQFKATPDWVLWRRWLLPALTQHETGHPGDQKAPPGSRAYGEFLCLWLPAAAVLLLLTEFGQVISHLLFHCPSNKAIPPCQNAIVCFPNQSDLSYVSGLADRKSSPSPPSLSFLKQCGACFYPIIFGVPINIKFTAASIIPQLLTTVYRFFGWQGFWTGWPPKRTFLA